MSELVRSYNWVVDHAGSSPALQILFNNKVEVVFSTLYKQSIKEYSSNGKT